tara:strand:- start:4489 stop:4884 length:396 start_codon:yes stop_codon:yes gene_type:complete
MNKKFIKITTWIIDCWRVVMDHRFNPLRFIPDPSLQMYFTVVLFTMWSVYFGFVATYYMGWLGYDIILSIAVHLGVLIPLFFTNAIFLDAERNGSKWLKDVRVEIDIDAMDKRLKQRNYEKRVKWDIDKEA